MPVEFSVEEFTTEELREFLGIAPPHAAVTEQIVQELLRRRGPTAPPRQQPLRRSARLSALSKASQECRAPGMS